MKKLLILLTLVSLTAIDTYAQSESITTFILVRHAEKASDGTDDPGLTPEGQDRAKRLAFLLKNTKVDVVLSTRYKRTKLTVEPTASAKNIPVEIYESVKADVIDALLAQHAGKTILVGGHSNTVPMFLNLLTGKDEYKTFPDSEYGNVFIATVSERGKAKVLAFSY